LLQLNLEFYTIWNYRKNAIPILFKDELTDRLEKELVFTFSCLLKSPKSYWVWHHRLWVLETLDSSVFWYKELEIVGQMLDFDVRNFHGWNYRRTLLDKIPDHPLQKEWEYSTTKIHQNFSNFSAWHYRSWLLSKLYRNDIPVIVKELELVRNAIFTEPSDQAPWYYHRILLGTCLSTDILESELEIIKSLLELEPDCKWALKTLVYITSRLNLKKEVGIAQKLALLDPKRKGLYFKYF
jgi:geranylgeranyl transferase type-2 subunit alpha